VIPADVRIFVCTQPQDMRRSFDALEQAARHAAGVETRNGALFVFLNKRCNRLKVLWFDRNGFCILYKRLHQAAFRLPFETAESARQINARVLAELLAGVDRSTKQ
jgi:transposase